jgi:hypothetical protein
MDLRGFLQRYFGWCPMAPGEAPPQRSNTLNVLDGFLVGWRNYLITMIVFSSILAYSLLVVPPPLIPVSSTPDTWGKIYDDYPYASEPLRGVVVGEPDVVMSDQTVLEGDETLSFEDQTVLISDLLLLKDDSKLVLRNCTFIVPYYSGYSYEDIFHEFAGVVFNGSSTLEAHDSIFVPFDRTCGIGFMGSSTCILDNVILVNCTLGFDDDSRLNADNSYIQEIDADRASSLWIRNSTVKSLRQVQTWRSRWVNPVKADSPVVTCEDTVIDLLEIRVVNSSRCILDDAIGRREHWNSYDDMRIDGRVMNLTLISSEVVNPPFLKGIFSVFNVTGTEVLMLQALMSEVYLDDADAWIVSIAGNSSATIRNSNIYYFRTANHHPYYELFRSLPDSSMHQHAEISESRIESLSISGYCDLVFDRVYVADADISEVEATVTGDVTWVKSSLSIYNPYSGFALTQVYEVDALGEERMIPGATLSLMDREGSVIWSGVSDENGLAVFNLTFCSHYGLYEPYHYVTNYNDTWTLTGTFEGETRTRDITLFETGSPIILDFSKDVAALPIDNRVLTWFAVSVILIVTVLKVKATFLQPRTFT